MSNAARIFLWFGVLIGGMNLGSAVGLSALCVAAAIVGADAHDVRMVATISAIQLGLVFLLNRLLLRFLKHQ